MSALLCASFGDEIAPQVSFYRQTHETRVIYGRGNKKPYLVWGFTPPINRMCMNNCWMRRGVQWETCFKQWPISWVAVVWRNNVICFIFKIFFYFQEGIFVTLIPVTFNSSDHTANCNHLSVLPPDDDIIPKPHWLRDRKSTSPKMTTCLLAGARLRWSARSLVLSLSLSWLPVT